MKEELTGNVGEWSEAYVFFSLLGNHTIYSCSADLESIKTDSFPVIEIQRGKTCSGALSYRLKDEKWTIYEEDKLISKNIDTSQGKSEAEHLLNELKKAIKEKQTSNRSFPKAAQFLKLLQSSSIKANSADKKDITLTINDARAGGFISCGFSIKSFLSGAPTLLNASSRTMFPYNVKGISKEDAIELNKLEIGQLVSGILERGGTITWGNDMNDQYRENMYFVDTAMPKIIASYLLNHFTAKGSTTKRRKDMIADVTERVAKEDPLKFKNEELYAYKMKKFLEATALGMIPSKPWKGLEEANGGFIVVKPEGEIVTFHIYNRNAFMDYLYAHTFFDTPSTGRYKCGKLIQGENDNFTFTLPLQVRYSFKKK